MTVQPSQLRTIDPYAPVDAELFNRLTRLISNSSDCIVHNDPIVVSKTNNITVSLSVGHCIKDDVLIQITSPFVIDVTSSEFYTEFGGTAWSETGYYYVVMKYVYVVEITEPVATVHLVLPSLRTGWNSSGDYLLLGILNVTDPGTREVTSVIKTDGTETVNYSDIGNNLFVDSSGNVVMQIGNFHILNGNAANPSITFSSDTDTGMYRAGADTLGFSTGGVERIRIDSYGTVTLQGLLRISDGSVGNPSLAFTNDTNTGLFRTNENQVSIACGGILVSTFYTGGLSVSGALSFSSQAYGGDGSIIEPSYSFNSDWNTGMYRITADTLGFSTGGSNRLSIGATGNVTIETGIIKNTDGFVSVPSYTFNNDTDTGMYRITADTIGFSCGGLHRVKIGSDGTLIVDAGIEINASGNKAFIASWQAQNDDHRGNYKWNTLQLGNNGANYIVAGNTVTSGYMQFVVNNTVDLNGVYSNTHDGIVALTLAADATATFSGGVEIATSITGLGSVFNIKMDTVDGSDNKQTSICGGGDADAFRGGYIALNGNEFGSGGGEVAIIAGDTSSSGIIRFYISNAESWRITRNHEIYAISPQCRIYNGDGSAAFAAYGFVNEPDTGMYRIGTNALGFTTGGVVRMSIINGNLNLLSGAVFYAEDGSEQLPGISFGSDSNTGMWRVGENILGFTTGGVEKMRISSGGVAITGSLSITGTSDANIKAFKIDHPLDPDNKYLIHTSIEGPQCDLIYKGQVDLVDGVATVDLDLESKMTPGTFDALNKNPLAWLQNDTGWDRVKGNVNQGILNITCENNNSTDTINWMVVGTRKDDNIIGSDLTDNNGDLITEPSKN